MHTTDRYLLKLAHAVCGIKKQQVAVYPAGCVSIWGNYWQGGYKREYHFVKLSGEIAELPPQNPLSDDVRPVKIPLPEGVLCFIHIYSGTHQYIEVYLHPENLIQAIPVQPTLSSDEETVLLATRCYKSTYAGIPNYRYHEAHRRTGITFDRWQTARDNLIARQFLSMRGTITAAGKNAIQGKDL